MQVLMQVLRRMVQLSWLPKTTTKLPPSTWRNNLMKTIRLMWRTIVRKTYNDTETLTTTLVAKTELWINCHQIIMKLNGLSKIGRKGRKRRFIRLKNKLKIIRTWAAGKTDPAPQWTCSPDSLEDKKPVLSMQKAVAVLIKSIGRSFLSQINP